MDTIGTVAHGIGAFRACAHGDAIAYTATLEVSGPRAVATIFESLRSRNYLSDSSGHDPSHGDCFAVLDMTDADCCWFNNACIPDGNAFDHIREALNLRIASSDCDHDCD